MNTPFAAIVAFFAGVWVATPTAEPTEPVTCYVEIGHSAVESHVISGVKK